MHSLIFWLVSYTGTTLLTVLAKDSDGRDNIITYDIIYEMIETVESSASGSGEGLPTTNPIADRFNFSISSEGAISNDKILPTVAEGDVCLLIVF